MASYLSVLARRIAESYARKHPLVASEAVKYYRLHLVVDLSSISIVEPSVGTLSALFWYPRISPISEASLAYSGSGQLIILSISSNDNAIDGSS